MQWSRNCASASVPVALTVSASSARVGGRWDVGEHHVLQHICVRETWCGCTESAGS